MPGATSSTARWAGSSTTRRPTPSCTAAPPSMPSRTASAASGPRSSGTTSRTSGWRPGEVAAGAAAPGNGSDLSGHHLHRLRPRPRGAGSRAGIRGRLRPAPGLGHRCPAAGIPAHDGARRPPPQRIRALAHARRARGPGRLLPRRPPGARPPRGGAPRHAPALAALARPWLPAGHSHRPPRSGATRRAARSDPLLRSVRPLFAAGAVGGLGVGGGGERPRSAHPRFADGGHELRLGPAPPSGPARRLPHLRLPGGALAPHAQLDAGADGPGLRPHGASERSVRSGGAAQARTAELAAQHDHALRSHLSGAGVRRGDRGADLRPARDGEAHLRRRAGPRHARADGRGHAGRRDDHAGPVGLRPALRRGGSAHLVEGPMRRSLWKRFAARPRNLLGLGLALSLALVATFADFIASERPIVLRRAGTTYLFPNLIEYRALRGFSAQDLGPADWALWPPVRHGPYTIPPLATIGGPLPRPPGGDHPLGTDNARRATLPRLLHGARTSLGVGFAAATAQVLIGPALGVVAGSLGGLVHPAIHVAAEVLLSF